MNGDFGRQKYTKIAHDYGLRITDCGLRITAIGELKNL